MGRPPNTNSCQMHEAMGSGRVAGGPITLLVLAAPRELLDVPSVCVASRAAEQGSADAVDLLPARPILLAARWRIRAIERGADRARGGGGLACASPGSDRKGGPNSAHTRGIYSGGRRALRTPHLGPARGTELGAHTRGRHVRHAPACIDARPTHALEHARGRLISSGHTLLTHTWGTHSARALQAYTQGMLCADEKSGQGLPFDERA